MSRSLRSQVGHYLCWIFALGMHGATAIGSAQTTCYSSPSVAIESLKVAPSPLSVLKDAGYRVIGIQSDPILGQRWAIVANCAHSEWPDLAIQTGILAEIAPLQTYQRPTVSSVPLVHVGDIVRLWKQEDLLQIEVAGVSEESGGLGETIRVRLLPRNPDGQWIPERFSGIVRGPSDVEMQP